MCEMIFSGMTFLCSLFACLLLIFLLKVNLYGDHLFVESILSYFWNFSMRIIYFHHFHLIVSPSSPFPAGLFPHFFNFLKLSLLLHRHRHTHSHTYTCIHTNTSIYTCLCIYTYVCTYVYIYCVCVYPDKFISFCSCVYVLREAHLGLASLLSVGRMYLMSPSQIDILEEVNFLWQLRFSIYCNWTL